MCYPAMKALVSCLNSPPVWSAHDTNANIRRFGFNCIMGRHLTATPPSWKHGYHWGATTVMEETFQPHRYLLFLRFILLNLVGASLLGSAYMQGWLDGFFVDVTFELLAVIGGAFLLGLTSCGNKIWRTSVELNDINSGAPATGSRAGKYLQTIYGGGAESRTIAAAALRLKLSSSAAAMSYS